MGNLSKLLNRMVRAAILKADLYDEVKADPKATFQAAGVVLLVSCSVGVGLYSSYGIPGIVRIIILYMFSWIWWTLVLFLVGTKWLPEPQTKPDFWRLLRTIGFASTPGILLVFSSLEPRVGSFLLYSTSIWIWFGVVVAVRQALDYESKNFLLRFSANGTERAIRVCFNVVGIPVALFAILIWVYNINEILLKLFPSLL